jgi:FkbM family methyltransferase
MPMISYAQNREDVRLARAFAGRASGFYVDVGAHDPVIFSMTKHFYELGWHGLNLEAAPDAADAIQRARPRDTTVNVGVSDTEGELVFYQATSDAAGLSTFARDQAERHRAAGFRFTERRIRVTSLTTLCEEHVREPIDFMSIDVEGFERNVLEGADLQRYRPKAVVVEATHPKSREPSHGAWEHLLLRASFRFVSFDGLNRFYVAEEHAELAEQLAIPANPHDDFIPHEYHAKIDALKQKLSDESLPIRIARGMVSAARAISRFSSRRDG